MKRNFDGDPVTLVRPIRDALLKIDGGEIVSRF
jgi:hypothetical protein